MKTPTWSAPVWIASGFAALALSFGLGFWIRGGDDRPAGATAAADEREVLYWYDPMYPDKRFDEPGPSPFMDMELVPKYAEGDRSTGTVRIDPTTVQNLGVRTVEVGSGTLPGDAVVPGTITWNIRQSFQVSARTGGVIERLHVRAPFESVHEGQALAELIAPEWSSAIAEYRALSEAGSEAARALRSAARSRLAALGMDEAQIRQLSKGSAASTVILRSPADGVVSEIDVREGQQVSRGMPLMTVNGLDTVWVEAAVPQAMAGRVRVGTPVQARVSASPGEPFAGEVEALLPTVDPVTRTQTARIVLENPGHRLAPGMFAEIHFAGEAGEQRVLVPDEALIATGEQARVIVAEGEGRFRPLRVRTGRSAGGMTEILAGLEGGERVVVSGQFLIDSEASLSGALERLRPPEDDPSDGRQEGDR